jgi:hypothetical protein
VVLIVQYYDESRKVLLEQDQSKGLPAGTPTPAKAGQQGGPYGPASKPATPVVGRAG